MTRGEATRCVLEALRSVIHPQEPIESGRTLREIGLTQRQCDEFLLVLFIGERLGCNPRKRPSASITLRTTLDTVIRTYQTWYNPVALRGDRTDTT